MATKIKSLEELDPNAYTEQAETVGQNPASVGAETPAPPQSDGVTVQELLAMAMEKIGNSNPKLAERLRVFRDQTAKQAAAEEAQREANALAEATAAILDAVREAVYGALTNVQLPDEAGGLVVWAKRSDDGAIHLMDVQGAALSIAKYEKAASAYQTVIADKKRTSGGTPTERDRTTRVVVSDGTTDDTYQGRGPVAACLTAYGVTDYYSRKHPSGPSVTTALAALAIEQGKVGKTITIHKASGTTERLPTA